MLTNADYRWSPVLWTTVVTGKLPNRHGVTGFMAYNPGEGKSIPTPSTYRRCRALWNVFTERERTVGRAGSGEDPRLEIELCGFRFELV